MKNVKKLKNLKMLLFAFNIFIYSSFAIYCHEHLDLTRFCISGTILFLVLFYLSDYVEMKFLQAVFKERNEMDANLIAKVRKFTTVAKRNDEELKKYAILWGLLREGVSSLDNSNEWTNMLNNLEKNVEKDIDDGKYDEIMRM